MYIIKRSIGKLTISYITIRIYNEHFEYWLTIIKIALYCLLVRGLKIKAKLIIKAIEISS